MKNLIRNYALASVHDFESFELFEAAVIAFGESLPPMISPTAKDPHYRYLCRGSAKWVWERKDTVWRTPPPGITPYGEQRKAWAREWSRLRREFLEGRLADAVVFPVEDGHRWECPFCGESGSVVKTEARALTAGRGHMQTHVSDEDREALEDLKVTRMPENLLTPFQRNRRATLENNES